MGLIPHIALVLAACLADGLFGDPVYLLHPIRLLGAWSLLWEKILFAYDLDGYVGGIIHWLLVVGAARRWHGMLPSPNSGWSEAACAGALRVRLIGPICYQGQLVNKAFMGDEAWPADLDGSHLDQALRLILVSGLLALAFGLSLAVSAYLAWPWVWEVWSW